MTKTENYTKTLLPLSVDALKSLAKDIRAQVDIGLMTSKDAHDMINCISAVLMDRELEALGIKND